MKACLSAFLSEVLDLVVFVCPSSSDEKGMTRDFMGVNGKIWDLMAQILFPAPVRSRIWWGIRRPRCNSLPLTAKRPLDVDQPPAIDPLPGRSQPGAFFFGIWMKSGPHPPGKAVQRGRRAGAGPENAGQVIRTVATARAA
jgi:hypothetical protein